MYSWFHDSARAHPNRLALSAGDVELTYAELDRAAASVVLPEPGKPRRAGLLGQAEAATYVAYLAALRAGVTVVPLNAKNPLSRNADIVRRGELDLLLHTEAEAGRADALHEATGVPLLLVTGNDRAPVVAPPADPHPEAFAYIVFTSGSTGVPKGVPIRHRHFESWLPHLLDHFATGPEARVAQTSDLSWDLSVWNMFLAWGSGGAVVVPSSTDLLMPTRFIVDHEITHWHSTPSSITVARLLGELGPDSMPSLRWSVFCGEPLTHDHVHAWSLAAPASRVANVYGQTEVTVSSWVHDVDLTALPSTAVPIGKPHNGVEWAVISDDGYAAEEGELLVRGPQRFDGYLAPEHNSGRFVRWEAGVLEECTGEITPEHWYRTGDRVSVRASDHAYLGRLDGQVKIRGHRVELGDVEAVLRSHPLVDDAVVVAARSEVGTYDLAGFHQGGNADEEVLKEFLSDRLPAHMVPRLLLGCDSFPLSLNGKVDRKRLAEEAVALLATGAS
ncbi:AMP-binding protein [Lentzea alba]|uniref:AMP-binding protein n=1 Tax=Lentzea alba TaxID=2714351 RepID=UPI0039BF36F5